MFSLPLPVDNVQLEPETVASLVAERYGMSSPVHGEFVRRGFNDTYRITTAEEETYFLRVYLQGKYYISGPDDLQWELDLLDFLHANGVPVSHPLPQKNGGTLGKIETAGGERYFALFTNAKGDPGRRVNAMQARNWGDALARFHTTANRFRSSLPRYQMNLTYLVEQPIALLTAYWARQGRADELAPLIAYADELSAKIREFAADYGAGDEYGIIHGDPHGGNIHFDGDHPTLFDFDLGGYGWRAWDVATCQLSLHRKGENETDMATCETNWQAFLDAYTHVRPLTPAERYSARFLQDPSLVGQGRHPGDATRVGKDIRDDERGRCKRGYVRRRNRLFLIVSASSLARWATYTSKSTQERKIDLWLPC